MEQVLRLHSGSSWAGRGPFCPRRGSHRAGVATCWVCHQPCTAHLFPCCRRNAAAPRVMRGEVSPGGRKRAGDLEESVTCRAVRTVSSLLLPQLLVCFSVGGKAEPPACEPLVTGCLSCFCLVSVDRLGQFRAEGGTGCLPWSGWSAVRRPFHFRKG